MFGELVCGPPGSGKTTYCEGKRQFLSVYDPTRPVVLFNLDPANEDIFPYPCDVDIREVVDHRRVMEEEQLGPNGSYLLCAAIMHRHLDWMVTQIETAVERRMQEVLASMASPALSSSSSAAAATQLRAPYLIIDCPGQVEFYVDASIMHAIFRVLQKRLQCSLCSVHLVDAAIAMRDLPTYASACLLSLTTMIDHELPHVNLLSKWDTIPPEEMGDDSEGGASFLNASALLADGGFERLWRQQLRRRRHAHRMAQHFVTSEHPEPQLSLAEQEEEERLEAVDLEKDGGRIYHYTRLLMEVISDYSLVGFQPLDVQNETMMLHATQEIDNAMGNFF